MTISARYRKLAQLGRRVVDRTISRRQRLRKAFLACLTASVAFGYCAEAPAVDLFVKLRANSARKAETMTLEDLAALVDEIDRELQRKGRVMVKQPDVWGQNRLTSQRVRYNKLMEAEEPNFELLLNSYMGTVDNAALTYEMRLRQQVLPDSGTQPSQSGTTPPSSGGATNQGATSPATSSGGSSGGLTTPPSFVSPVPATGTTQSINVGVQPANVLIDTTKSTSGGTATARTPFSAFSTGSGLSLANNVTGTDAEGNPTHTPKPGLGLEPTIRIDEKSRYIQHVQQLLRNNTGDDKTDMPGYGLYLVRMPVSIMPGSNTMRDNGAVVTAEIKHNITGDLLKQMMRRVVLREATFNMANLLRAFDLDSTNSAFNTSTSVVGAIGAGAPKERSRRDETARLIEKARSRMVDILVSIDADQKIDKSNSRLLEKINSEFDRSDSKDGQSSVSIDEALKEYIIVENIINQELSSLIKFKDKIRELHLVNRELLEAKLDFESEDEFPTGSRRSDQLIAFQKACDSLKNETIQLTEEEVLTIMQTPEYYRVFADMRPDKDILNASSNKGAFESILNQIKANWKLDSTNASLPSSFNGLYFTADDIRTLHKEWVGYKHKNDNKDIIPKAIHAPDAYLWLNQEFADTVGWLEQLMKNPQNGQAIKDAGNQIRQAYRNGQLGLSKAFNKDEFGGYLTLDRARVNLFKQLILAINDSQLTSELKKIFNEDAKLLDEFKGSGSDLATPAKPDAQKSDSFPRIQIRNRFTLAYTYFLYSSIVNEQLKADMKVMAERKGIVMDEAELMDFDCFNPDDLAKSFFTDYVQAKWPIQVFSLDPAVDQQNEADSLSRRSDLQVALAQAVANGTVEFTQALQYARRIEQEFATIGLNRTAVGFGAGSTTFGWKFYPRFQTPPNPTTPERIAGLIFTGGPTRRWDMAHRQIEPGPRECVALVVAPNFIPSIRMTTTTNWFDLTPNMHHGNEKISNADMIRLGRQITMARHAFQRLCDDGHYRAGDIERLQDRITQLENMLPSQTTDIQLPFEGDWYGMELFASDGARLAPRLFMWYGEPPKQSGLKKGFTVDPRDSTKILMKPGSTTEYYEVESESEKSILLIGQGFSVTETKVVIGGVALKSDEFDLMSRNVMRARIPNGAGMVKRNGRDFIDVHVATPNGVSNHLYMEIDSGSQQDEEDSGKTEVISPTTAFYLKPNSRIIDVVYGRNNMNDTFLYQNANNSIEIQGIVVNNDLNATGKVGLRIDITSEHMDPLIFKQVNIEKGQIILGKGHIRAIAEKLKEHKFLDKLKSSDSGLGTIYTATGKLTVIKLDENGNLTKEGIPVDPGFQLRVTKKQPIETKAPGVIIEAAKLNSRDASYRSIARKEASRSNSIASEIAEDSRMIELSVNPRPSTDELSAKSTGRSESAASVPEPVANQPSAFSSMNLEAPSPGSRSSVPDFPALSDPGIRKQSFEQVIPTERNPNSQGDRRTSNRTGRIASGADPIGSPVHQKSGRANLSSGKVYSTSERNASQKTGIPLPK